MCVRANVSWTHKSLQLSFQTSPYRKVSNTRAIMQRFEWNSISWDGVAAGKYVVDAQVMIKYHIFLTTIEDGPTHSTEVKKEEHRLTEDQPPKASSYLAAMVGRARTLHVLLCIVILHHWPRQQDSGVSPTVYRHFIDVLALLAQRGVLKDLGIIGNDWRLDKGANQIYGDCL